MKTAKDLMKSVFATATLTMLIGSPFAFAGPGDGGGGSGVVLANGDVRLIDLLSQAEVSQAAQTAPDSKTVLKALYKQNKFVKQLGQKDPAFFSCASRVLKASASQYPIFNELISSLSDAEVLQVQFQIAAVDEATSKEVIQSMKIPALSTASRRLSTDRQSALATFANNQVWVSNRLYVRLSERDQCGLGVHEAFRQLNFAGLLASPLTQDEIEVATRYFMGAAALSDAGSWANVHVKLRHANTDVNGCRSDHAFKAERNRLVAELTKAEAEFANEPYGTSRYTELYNQQMATLDKLRKLAVDGLKCIDSQIGHSPKLKMIANMGILPSVVVEQGLTTPLRGSLYWDVLNLKVVSR